MGLFKFLGDLTL